MIPYRVTFAKLDQSASHVVRSDFTIEAVTLIYGRHLPIGWTLTVERIV